MRHLLLVAAAGAIGGTAAAQEPSPSGAGVTDAEVLAIVHKHCVSCHAARPTHQAFAAPPKDVALETLADLRRHADAVLQQTVLDRAMPLGNPGGMTERDRARLGAWLRGL